MKISIKGFIYHKIAEGFADCFDRYGVNENTNKFAVSDGVSKSFFPGIWAELLVDSFINTEGKINLIDTKLLKSIQDEWVKRVAEIANRPNQKYFVRNFFAQGRPAAATFVGLSFFKEGGKIQWESFALGDSFLFFVPDEIKNIDENFDKIIYLSSKNDFEFNNFPDFFDSRNKINKGKIKQRKNELTEGTFYMMTDALSEWFILEKQKAIQEISLWKNQIDFEKSISGLRKTSLQNDDSAILIITVEEDNSDEINYSDISITNLDELLGNEKEVNQIKIIEKDIIARGEKLANNDKQDLIVDGNIRENEDTKDNQLSNDKDKSTDSIDENRKQEQISIIKNQAEEIKKQKKGFWERGWEIGWEIGLEVAYFFIPAKKDHQEKNIPYENFNKKEVLKEDQPEIGEQEPINKPEIEQTKDLNEKKKKGSENSTKPDEDISSITDKF